MATIGIVSPGEMGSALARVLAEGGSRIVGTIAGRSERTERFAAQAGIELLTDLDAVVGESEVVLSVAPPDQAQSIANEIAAAANRVAVTPLVVDLNAIAPSTVRRIEELLGCAGLELVDASISGPPPRLAGTTRIYVSGPSSTRFLALAFPGVDLIPVGTAVGTASAVKMSTASVYKGTAALLTQALLTARASGVVDHVVADLARGLPEIAGRAPTTIARAATKSVRYVGEMKEIAATQAAAGLSPALFEAFAAVYASLAGKPLAAGKPEDVSADLELDAVLDGLS